MKPKKEKPESLKKREPEFYSWTKTTHKRFLEEELKSIPENDYKAQNEIYKSLIEIYKLIHEEDVKRYSAGRPENDLSTESVNDFLKYIDENPNIKRTFGAYNKYCDGKGKWKIKSRSSFEAIVRRELNRRKKG